LDASRLLFCALVATCTASKNGVQILGENYKGMDIPSALLSNTVKILEYKDNGNSSYLVRVVEDHDRNQGIEYMKVLTIPDNYMVTNNGFEDDDDDLYYAPNDSVEIPDNYFNDFNSTREKRGFMNRCNRVSLIEKNLMSVLILIFFTVFRRGL